MQSIQINSKLLLLTDVWLLPGFEENVPFSLAVLLKNWWTSPCSPPKLTWSLGRCLQWQAQQESALPVWIASSGSLAASWSATAPIPWAGRQLDPVARHLITNSKSLLVTLSSRSKKMPPRKGRKKRSMMASEKPSFCTTFEICARCLRQSSSWFQFSSPSMRNYLWAECIANINIARPGTFVQENLFRGFKIQNLLLHL